jgi:hypothetical protein
LIDIFADAAHVDKRELASRYRNSLSGTYKSNSQDSPWALATISWVTFDYHTLRQLAAELHVDK